MDEAWDDLQACHRLGRLIATGPTTVECLTGNAVDGMAFDGDWKFAYFGRLTPERALKCWADIRKLPPLPHAVDKASISERFAYLDIICGTVRDSVKPEDMFPLLPGMTMTIAGVDSTRLRDALRQWIGSGLVDWDEVLRLGNQHFDRVVEAANKPQVPEAWKLASALDEELKKQVASFRDVRSNAIARAAELVGGRTPRQIATQCVSAIYLLNANCARALVACDCRAILIYPRLTEIALALRTCFEIA
jgi:hypothetical protein